jgi:hypothetical protein
VEGVCPGVWPRGERVWWVSERSVEDIPLVENPNVGRPDGWGRVLFVVRGHQQRPGLLCGAEGNGCGTALREANTPYRKQHQVGAEAPLLFLVRLGWVRLVWVRLG